MTDFRPPAPRRELRALSSWHWNAALLVFVTGALIASVFIPAQATSHIMSLFSELNTVVEPARRGATTLQATVAAEAEELQGYALSGDTSALSRYRITSRETDRQVALLAMLADQLDADIAADVQKLRHDLADWRRSAQPLLARGPKGEISAGETERNERIASIASLLTSLQLRLADENQQRRHQVQAAGHLSLLSNALLVLAALTAIATVVLHMLRERQLMAVLRERATREASLRSAAETLAAAFTFDDVAQEIARSAVTALRAHGAFVTHIVDNPDAAPDVVVLAAAGSEVPAVGAACALGGSCAERGILSEGPMFCYVDPADPLMQNVSRIGPSLSTIVIRLHDGEVARGALFVLSRTGFDADDMVWARTFEHIATLAYEKVRLLENANEGRRKLESAMDSRSRLMRGFSHDVKNPLGAADGHAALILEGIYGQLTSPQRQSLERVRRSLKVGLGLIDDLNDFARAEAGKVTLKITTVDVAELMQTVATQYEASAHAKGLALIMGIVPGLPHIETDPDRLRQVTSNLLSNSIKYTDCGSVRLQVGPSLDAEGVTNGISVAVTDTGPGIPAAQQTHIFDEFTRLDSTHQPGAGLGLAISKLLAELLGGSISIDSEVGVGSTFTLWIPAHPPDEPPLVVAGGKSSWRHSS